LAKTASFFSDFDKSLDVILQWMRPNAYMIWTVGNRRVAKTVVPMDDILTDLLLGKNASFVHKIERTIPTKRMANKNQIAQTMTQESVLIFRTASKRAN
jgi:hypothetical protein